MVAKCCLLMYSVNYKRNKSENLGQWLEKSKEIQQKAIKRAQMENSDSIEEFRITLSSILKKYFQYYTDLKENEPAEKALREAIIQNESDIEVKD